MKKDYGIEVNATTVTLTLTGKDTKFGGIINKPTNYWYEIELNPETNPQTIVGYDDEGPKLFCLHPEGNETEETEPEEADVGAFDDKLDLTSNKALPNWLITKEFLAIKGEIKKTGDNAVYVSTFGAKGDGDTDDREAIENALAALTDNSTLVFPKGHYVIKSFPENFNGLSNSKRTVSHFFGVSSKKNITIDLDDSTIALEVPSLMSDGNGFPRYSIFLIEDCENFAIKNGTIIGDRITHDYTNADREGSGASHEWGVGVKIFSTKPDENVCSGVVENLTLSDFTGEGISVYNGYKYGRVKVKSCEVSKCRRHGIVIGDSNNVTVDGCYIHHIGTFDNVGHVANCAMGIDIECEGLESLGYRKEAYGIKILNTTIEETDGHSISIASFNTDGTVKYTVDEIFIDNCIFTGAPNFSGATSKEKDADDKYPLTPVLIKNSTFNHDKMYLSESNKINNNFDSIQITLDGCKLYNCIINGSNDDYFYTKRSIFVLGVNKYREKDVFIKNSVINLMTPNTRLSDCKLDSCLVQGGLIYGYEQTNVGTIRDCTNVRFEGSKIKFMQPKGTYKFINCSFINCYSDEGSNPKNLPMRNCYLDTDCFTTKHGTPDYVNCVIEDEITV